MTYQDVIDEFRKKYKSVSMSDEYLGTPRSDLPVCGEHTYGVVWTRDDAVKLLIDRIEDLEETIERDYLHCK